MKRVRKRKWRRNIRRSSIRELCEINTPNSLSKKLRQHQEIYINLYSVVSSKCRTIRIKRKSWRKTENFKKCLSYRGMNEHKNFSGFLIRNMQIKRGMKSLPSGIVILNSPGTRWWNYVLGKGKSSDFRGFLYTGSELTQFQETQNAVGPWVRVQT